MDRNVEGERLEVTQPGPNDLPKPQHGLNLTWTPKRMTGNMTDDSTGCGNRVTRNMATVLLGH